MAEGFSSPKLTQHIADGFDYMKKHENEFDVIITDSSDPVGMHTYQCNSHHSSSLTSKVLPSVLWSATSFLWWYILENQLPFYT